MQNDSVNFCKRISVPGRLTDDDLYNDKKEYSTHEQVITVSIITNLHWLQNHYKKTRKSCNNATTNVALPEKIN